MIVSFSNSGVDALDQDCGYDRRSLRLLPIKIDRAGKLRKPSVGDTEKLVDLESYSRMCRVEFVGFTGPGG